MAVTWWFFDPAGLVLGVYILGMAVLGAIVGAAVYGLGLFLRKLFSHSGETRDKNHSSLDLFADERGRDKIFGVQWIQSFLPDYDTEPENQSLRTGKGSAYSYFGRFGFGGQPSDDRRPGLRWVLRQSTQRSADYERALAEKRRLG